MEKRRRANRFRIVVYFMKINTYKPQIFLDQFLKRYIAVHELPYPYDIAWAQKNGEKHEKETSNRMRLSVRNFNCSKSESQMKTIAHKWKRLTKTLHFAQVHKRQVYFSRNSFLFLFSVDCVCLCKLQSTDILFKVFFFFHIFLR